MIFRVGPGTLEHQLVIEGELDLATVDRLRSAVDLCTLVENELVLDCSGLTFIDGTGCQAFIDIAENLTNGSTLVLDGPRGFPLRVLALLRLDSHPRVEVRP